MSRHTPPPADITAEIEAARTRLDPELQQRLLTALSQTPDDGRWFEVAIVTLAATLGHIEAQAVKAGRLTDDDCRRLATIARASGLFADK